LSRRELRLTIKNILPQIKLSSWKTSGIKEKWGGKEAAFQDWVNTGAAGQYIKVIFRRPYDI